MAEHAVWKGSINFGLVSIPIELYSAVKPHVIGFKMLHSVCNTPITNRRWCTHCDHEIAWEEIVKGLKLEDGTYFVITKENLKKLRSEKTDTIDVLEFVETHEVPAVYYDQHYYVIPQKKAEKAFYLLAAALKSFKQSAIAQFVLRDKDYVCLLQPFENAMLMTTLHYGYEVKPLHTISKLKVPAKLDKQELQLAELLMSKLYKKTFDISHFKDTFALRLAKSIKHNKGGKVVEIESPKSNLAPEVSLMESLRASLREYEKNPPAGRGR
jgi:DNA end-binding protein Ku